MTTSSSLKFYILTLLWLLTILGGLYNCLSLVLLSPNRVYAQNICFSNISFSSPQLLANGSDEDLLLVTGQPLSLSLDFNNESFCPKEIWLAVQTKWGWYFFAPSRQWRQKLTPWIMTRLPNKKICLPNLVLPPGKYNFYLVVDNFINNRVDSSELQSIQISVLPLLKSLEVERLKERIPIILLHGNYSEFQPLYRWEEFIKVANQDPSFADLFKIFLFKADSNYSNKANGLALGEAVQRTPELAGQDIILLAHSRGGLVARAYMNYYHIDSGPFKGKRAGDRVKYLLTLGTPHTGSPGADPVWTVFSFDWNYPSWLARILTDTYLKYIYSDSDVYMLWDDQELQIFSDTLCWYPSYFSGKEQFCLPLASIYSPIQDLNISESYHHKIIAFGGYVQVQQGIYPLLTQALDLDPEANALKNQELHAVLRLGSFLMGKFPFISDAYKKDGIDDSYLPFQANDGLVPLNSALMIPLSTEETFVVKERQLIYKPEVVKSLCPFAECIVLEDRMTDHLDYLDNTDLLTMILQKLKNIY